MYCIYPDEITRANILMSVGLNDATLLTIIRVNRIITVRVSIYINIY